MTLRKVSCPECGQQAYEAERICPFCSHPIEQEKEGSTEDTSQEALSDGPVVILEEIRPDDFRERVLGLPLWSVLAIVGGSAVLEAILLQMENGQGAGSVITSLLVQGPGALLLPMMLNVVQWLFSALILWLSVVITGVLSREPFEVGFLKGYRTLLPVAMLLLVVNNIGLLLSMLVSPFGLLAPIVNVFILRYFLDLDWFEVILLNCVLCLLNMLLFSGGFL